MEIVIAIIAIVLIVLLFKGMIKTFQRSIVGALLCFIFLGPIWLCWAIVEMFTGPVDKTVKVKIEN